MKKFLVRLWSGWKSVIQKIGDFQTSLVFSLFYFLLLSPLGMVVNLLKDYLERKSAPSWQKTEDSFESLEELRSQS